MPITAEGDYLRRLLAPVDMKLELGNQRAIRVRIFLTSRGCSHRLLLELLFSLGKS